MKLLNRLLSLSNSCKYLKNLQELEKVCNDFYKVKIIFEC